MLSENYKLGNEIEQKESENNRQSHGRHGDSIDAAIVCKQTSETHDYMYGCPCCENSATVLNQQSSEYHISTP